MEKPLGRADAIEQLSKAREEVREAGMIVTMERIDAVLFSFNFMTSRAAGILGAIGGKTPPKPGSRPRGRPRKQPPQIPGKE